MSNRRVRRSPEDDATLHILSGKDKSCFEERFINSYKGRGVFALVNIEKGSFVLEYRGELISLNESLERHSKNTEKQNVFLFDFVWNGSSWCIDAAKEDGTLGRLVNDDQRNANCKMRKLVVNGKPHLCLFAIQNIDPGEEITYNYGNSPWPWRSLTINTSKESNHLESTSRPDEHIAPMARTRAKTNAPKRKTTKTSDPQQHLDSDGQTTEIQAKTNAPMRKTTKTSDPQQHLDSDGQTTEIQAKTNAPMRKTTKTSDPQQHLDSDGQTTEIQAKTIAPMRKTTKTSDPQQHLDSDGQTTEIQVKTKGPMRKTTKTSDPQQHLDSDGQTTEIQAKTNGPMRKTTTTSDPQQHLDSDGQTTEIQAKTNAPMRKTTKTSDPQQHLDSDGQTTEIQAKTKGPMRKTTTTSDPQEHLDSDGQTTEIQAKTNGPKRKTTKTSDPQQHLDSDGQTTEIQAKTNAPKRKTTKTSDPQQHLDSDGQTTEIQISSYMDESSDYSQYMDSDKDYDPSCSSDSSSSSKSDMASQILPKKVKRNKKEQNKLNKKQSVTSAKPVNRTQNQVCCAENISTSSHISSAETDASSVNVASMPPSSTGWKYKKKQYCLYCEKPFSKIARHLDCVHRGEADVAKAFSFDKKSKERRVRLRLLVSKGNFMHNAAVSSGGKGDLVACRRPQSPGSTQDFTHCIYCKGLYARKTLWRHIRICPLNPKLGESGPGKKKVQSLNCMPFSPPVDISKGFWKTVVCQMKHDEISDLIRNDKYILLLGEQMFNKLNPSATKSEYIRQKMREVGRLLLAARRMTPMRCMEDFVLPSNFPHVIKAVRCVAGHCEETNTYKIPSLALKLGHTLGKIATSVECNSIITGREKLAEDARNFKVLQEYKWNESISAAAGTTLNEAKMNKPQILPFTEDVKTLHFFLNKEMEKNWNSLKERSDAKSYASLCKLTLAKVVLFNRRRGGETARMKLESYVSREKSPIHEDLAGGLSDFEKKLCEHFQRVEIRGKRGRKVAVLLTPEMVRCMDLLIEKRDICQVPSENVHLFARPNALSSYRGSDALREYAQACGARNPTSLSSTKLRKQISTLSTVLNLKDNEMDQLASFLGHDIRIHRQYYRLPESTLQLAKMSKLLIAMEKGALKEIQGVQLDDIVINPEDEFEDSDDADSSSTETEQEDPPQSWSSRSSEPSTSVVSYQIPDSSSPQDQSERRGKKGINSESVPDKTQQDPSTQSTTISKNKRMWSDDEVHAVEKHLMQCINSGRVPGKKDCLSCLFSEPDALRGRDWIAIKYYVKNRIVALKRKQCS